MKKSLYVLFVLGLILGLFLVGCGGETPAADDGGAPAPSGDDDSGAPAPSGDDDTASDDDGDADAEETPPPPSVAQTAISKEIVLDPAITQDEDFLMVSSYLYEGLPALSNNIDISGDGLTYTFTLNATVLFHDGTPLTAEAVMANFNRWFDPGNELRGAGSYDAWEQAFDGFLGDLDDEGNQPLFDGVEMENAMTVLIHLSRPEDSLLDILAQPAFGIAEPNAIAGAGAAYGTSFAFPLGTGPYFVAEWTEDLLRLEPNPLYWGEEATVTLEFPLE